MTQPEIKPELKGEENPPYNKANDLNLSFEDRIMAYLDGKSGIVKLNSFLKSLYLYEAW